MVFFNRLKSEQNSQDNLKEQKAHHILEIPEVLMFGDNLYNKTRHSYIYMLPIAGQTAGPIGLKFFVDTQGWPGVF